MKMKYKHGVSPILNDSWNLRLNALLGNGVFSLIKPMIEHRSLVEANFFTPASFC